MTEIEQHLFNAMRKIVPLKELPARDARLTQLGFDSLALVTLFVDLAQEFQLSVDAMRPVLNADCTFDTLHALCDRSST